LLKIIIVLLRDPSGIPGIPGIPGTLGTKEMKRIKVGTLVLLVLLVLVLLLKFFNTSRFGALGMKDQLDYMVQLNFSYKNPGNFNGTWNGIVLYMEELSDSPNTPEVSISEDLFTSKNLFYTTYYSTFYRDYTSWIPNARKDILKDTKFITNLNKLLTGIGMSNNTDNYSNLNTLNDFIKHFKIPNNLYKETSDNKISITNGNVELSTLDSLGLKLKKKNYKFGLAIINNGLILNQSGYETFPFTISDFRFITFDIRNIISNPAGAPEDLSIYVNFL